MSFHINIIDTKLEFNWNDTRNEIGVHLKSKYTWHQLIVQLEGH